MKDKIYTYNRLHRLNYEEILEAKQQIAIEKYGDIFKDHVFFELELTMNEELATEINEEYHNRFGRKRLLN